MAAKQIHSEMRSIPWKQIFVPDNNVRQDLPRIKELGSSLEKRGQLQPVIVTNGGPPEQPYTLVGGFRRMAAFEYNGWQNREVLCVVRDYKKGDALGRFADNWRENADREDVSPFDQAERAHQLIAGTYPVLEGEEATPIPKDQACELLGLNVQSLNNLLRVFNNIDPKVAKKARKAGVPLRQLIAWAGLEGTGKDKVASRAEKQSAALDEWIAVQESLAAQGRKRAPRKGKKSGGEEEETAGALRPNKKIASGLKEKDDEGNTVDRKVAVADFMKVLEAKIEQANKEDALRLEGALNAIRFLTGAVKRFPGLNKDDFKMLEAAPAEEDPGKEPGEE